MNSRISSPYRDSLVFGFKFWLITLFLVFVYTTILFAQYTTTVYIDPTNSGDPGEDGSLSHPYDHINDVSITSNTMYLFRSGTDMMQTGEIQVSNKEYVYFGSYEAGERPILSHLGGRNFKIEKSNNITLEGLHVTSSDYSSSQGIYIQSNSSVGTHDVHINDCEISYKNSAVVWQNWGTPLDNIRISNCEIHHIKQDGIFGSSATNVIIENNHIHHINMNWDLVGHTQSQAGGDGIQVGEDCGHLIIRNNIIDRRNSGNKYCILFSTAQYYPNMSVDIIGNILYPPKDTTESQGGMCIGTHPFTERVNISHNIISGRGYDAASTPRGIADVHGDTVYWNYNVIDSIGVIDGPGAISAENLLEFYNNTMVSPALQSNSVSLLGPSTKYVRNNLIAVNTTSSSPIGIFGTGTYTMDHNIIHNSSDPTTYNSTLGIVDWESSDFHRTSDVNDGTDVGLEYDFDSVYVSNPPERGVCEYVDGSQSNNPPNINNQSFSIEENTPNGEEVGTIIATDPDQGQSLTYTILSGNTDNVFQLNSTTGELTVNNATVLDYETTPEFNLTVKVQDNGIGSLSDQATITIDLIDVNEQPEIEDQTFNLEENTPNNQQVDMILATDPDNNQELTYSIISGNTDNAFQVNSSTGELTVNNESVLDYETIPIFNLTIQVQDDGIGALSDQANIAVDLIDIAEVPIADFSSDSTSVIVGNEVNFFDESINLPANWIWQFEGGTPNVSFIKDPVITYNTPGIYNVGLVVSNTLGYDMLVKTEYIEVLPGNDPPVANFTSNTNNINAGASVFFQDESLNLPTNWIWQFEGGTPSSSFDENPVITYNAPGIYDVKLVASNTSGYDMITKTDYIEVETSNTSPIANFSCNTTTISAGEIIYFQDESINLPTNWIWQFEGGTPNTSFNQNPIITYNTPGIYNVQLIASNPNGYDLLLKTDYIEVQTNTNPPLADFTSNTTTITAGENVSFQDESLNFPINWIWQFEGGTPSTSFLMNPVITYNTPGLYNVHLVASNANGYDMLLKTDYIEVVENTNPPIASFSSNATIVTAGGGIYFQDESLNLPTNWIWQFEGGSPNTSFDENPIINYNTPGIYNVQLLTSNSYGYDIILQPSYIEVLPNSNPPIANFTANSTTVTAGGNIFFQDESLNLPTTWKWEFEGGVPNTSFDENPIVNYNIPGTYNVKLLASNSNGTDILLKLDYITVQANNKPPIANFTSNTTLITAGEKVYYQDESINFPTNWIWQFEGGYPSTSFNENPEITYNTPGIYNVQLVASNSNGYDIILKTDYIEVLTNNNPPIASFTANTTFIGVGESIFFYDESLNLPTNWIWQFEGGSPSTSFNKNPIIAYNTPGIYNVKLVASNTNGYDMLLKSDYIEVFEEKKGQVINDSVLNTEKVRYAMNLFPNPTYNFINISLPNINNEDYNVRIYSLFGEIAKEIQFNSIPGSLTKKIDISDLSNGTYILHLECGRTRERQKFIKL